MIPTICGPGQLHEAGIPQRGRESTSRSSVLRAGHGRRRNEELPTRTWQAVLFRREGGHSSEVLPSARRRCQPLSTGSGAEEVVLVKLLSHGAERSQAPDHCRGHLTKPFRSPPAVLS